VPLRACRFHRGSPVGERVPLEKLEEELRRINDAPPALEDLERQVAALREPA
jgi:hypothetical protein